MSQQQEIYLTLVKKLCLHPIHENFDCGKCGYYMFGNRDRCCGLAVGVLDILEENGIKVE